MKTKNIVKSKKATYRFREDMSWNIIGRFGRFLRMFGDMQTGTAILSCRYGPHEKSWKNRVGSTWFEIRAKSSLLGAEKLQEEHELSFRTSRRRFPRTENDEESSIAAYKLQLTPPAGTEAPPAGTEGFSSKLFNLASSSLGRFRRMNPRWKAWNPSKATAPFLLSCRQRNER